MRQPTPSQHIIATHGPLCSSAARRQCTAISMRSCSGAACQRRVCPRQRPRGRPSSLRPSTSVTAACRPPTTLVSAPSTLSALEHIRKKAVYCKGAPHAHCALGNSCCSAHTVPLATAAEVRTLCPCARAHLGHGRQVHVGLYSACQAPRLRHSALQAGQRQQLLHGGAVVGVLAQHAASTCANLCGVCVCARVYVCVRVCVRSAVGWSDGGQAHTDLEVGCVGPAKRAPTGAHPAKQWQKFLPCYVRDSPHSTYSSKIDSPMHSQVAREGWN